MCAGILGCFGLINSMERTLSCYTLWTGSSDHDPKALWQLVKRHGGQRRLYRDRVDYWIPPQYASLVVTAYPQLKRQPLLDYGQYQPWQPPCFDSVTTNLVSDQSQTTA